MGSIGQLSYREIGRSLGVPKGTVGSRVSRGRLILKVLVEELFSITEMQARDPTDYELRAMWMLREALAREYNRVRGEDHVAEQPDLTPGT